MSRLLGAWKRASRRLNIPLPEYAQHRANGERHCYRCRSWGPLGAFAVDRTSGYLGDRRAICRDCMARRKRERK